MSKISGYGVYQNSYYNSAVNSRSAKEKEQAGKADKSGKTEKKESTVQLSEKAKALLEELKKKYSNMDFIVADYETDEEASAYLAKGTKEFSVLMDPETLEEMAADEDAKAKYTGILEDAVGNLKDMREQLGDRKDEVAHLGVNIGKDGSVSYFADMEKIGDRQREFIEKTREGKKEEKAQQAKKAQEKALEEKVVSEKTKRTRVEAGSVEELLEKIKAVDWSQIKEEERPAEGGRFDFSV